MSVSSLVVIHVELISKLVPLHFPRIDKRRKSVLERRQKAKDRARERHEALLASEVFQKFKRDANEVSMV